MAVAVVEPVPAVALEAEGGNRSMVRAAGLKRTEMPRPVAAVFVVGLSIVFAAGRL